MRSSRATCVYRVRSSGLRVQIAHGTPDVLTLDQAFYQHVYEPPQEICLRLDALGRPLRALDLGANVGLWGLWLQGRFRVEHVTAVEPDLENATKHLRQIALNRLEGSWELQRAAATCSEQKVAFTVGRATTGHIVEQAQPGTAEVDGLDIFSMLEGVDLLKIDIEGAEWPILADERLGELQVPVVMLEYHPYGAPAGAPEDAARSALAGVGYKTASMHAAPDGTGIVWGLRSS
ncbi:MAG TPA: FkbM family methyltransferase [Solirubrobacteraceae bacterium]|jgi:FkbM family methyltransferase